MNVGSTQTKTYISPPVSQKSLPVRAVERWHVLNHRNMVQQVYLPNG